MYKLYANAICPYVQRVLIGKNIRKISDAIININEIEFSSPPKELVTINPNWTVPTLAYATNKGFDDSVHILEFLDTIDAPGPKLFGNNYIEIAAHRFLIRQLQHQVIQPLKESNLYLGNPTKLAPQIDLLLKGIEYLSSVLPSNKFFGGDTLKAADIVLAPFLAQLKCAHILNAQIPLPSPQSIAGKYINALLENTFVMEVCPAQKDLTSQMQNYTANPSQLIALQKASKLLLTQEEINQAMLDMPYNSPWQLEKDETSPYLKAAVKFKNPQDAIRSLTALHAMQETSDHHAKFLMTGFTSMEISLRTNKPIPGITAKDILFAQAFLELVLAEEKYGEREASIFN